MLQKLWLIFLAIVSWPIAWVWRKKPAVMLEQAIQQQARSLTGANEALAQSGGQVRTLTRRATKLREDKDKLEKTVQRCLDDGDNDKAARHAERLVDIESRLTATEADLKVTSELHDRSKRHVAQCRDALQDLQRRAETAKIRFESAQTRELLVKTLSAARDGIDDNLVREAYENLERQTDVAEERAAQCMEFSGVDDDLEEQEATRRTEVDAVLARFKNNTPSGSR